MTNLETKVAALSTDTLKEMAVKLFNDTRDGADLVLNATLDALMSRLPEDQFVAFCDGIQ